MLAAAEVVISYWELLGCFRFNLLLGYTRFICHLFFRLILIFYHLQFMTANLLLLKLILRLPGRLPIRIINRSTLLYLPYRTRIHIHRIHRRPKINRILEQLPLIRLLRPPLLLKIPPTHQLHTLLLRLDIKRLINTGIRSIQLILPQKFPRPLYLFLILRLLLWGEIDLRLHGNKIFQFVYLLLQCLWTQFLVLDFLTGCF